MPRKAKEKKPVADPRYLTDEGAGLKLPGLEFWKWRALTAELQRDELLNAMAKQSFEAKLAQHPELVDLRTKMLETKLAHQATSDALKTLMNDIKAATNIDTAKCSIDDETGQIFLFE